MCNIIFMVYASKIFNSRKCSEFSKNMLCLKFGNTNIIFNKSAELLRNDIWQCGVLRIRYWCVSYFIVEPWSCRTKIDWLFELCAFYTFCNSMRSKIAHLKKKKINLKNFQSRTLSELEPSRRIKMQDNSVWHLIRIDNYIHCSSVIKYKDTIMKQAESLSNGRHFAHKYNNLYYITIQPS